MSLRRKSHIRNQISQISFIPGMFETPSRTIPASTQSRRYCLNWLYSRPPTWTAELFGGLLHCRISIYIIMYSYICTYIQTTTSTSLARNHCGFARTIFTRPITLIGGDAKSSCARTDCTTSGASPLSFPPYRCAHLFIPTWLYVLPL